MIEIELYRPRAVGQDRPSLVVQSTEFLKPGQFPSKLLRARMANAKCENAAAQGASDQLAAPHDILPLVFTTRHSSFNAS